MASIYGKVLTKTMNGIGDLLLPNCCRYCRRETARGRGLCNACWRDLPQHQHCCRRCGIGIRGLAEPICKDCYQNPPPWRHGFSAAPYRGLARDMVLGLKHGGSEGLAYIMAELMIRSLRDEHITADRVFAMPIHWRRRLRRGFNQSELIARHIAKIGQWEYGGGLRRTRHTKPQARDFDAQMRDENVKDAFRYSGPPLDGQHILLVDDVLTSGASMRHLTYCLLQANPKHIDIIVFARAPQKH